MLRWADGGQTALACGTGLRGRKAFVGICKARADRDCEAEL